MRNLTNFYVLIGYINLLHKRIKNFIRHRQRRLDFIGIGVAKAGTTALYAYLNQHPEIGLGNKKEIHFFDRPENFFFPKWFYWRYHRHFNFKSGKKVYGEITPVYMYWRSAAADIYAYNPKIKLIAILRNPIDRAYSHWNMNIQLGYDTRDFDYAIAHEVARSRNRLPFQHHHYSLVDRGLYSAQIREYRRFFSDEQLLFIKYEDFKRDPEANLRKIFHFLAVNPNIFAFNPLKVNTFKYNNNINSETKNKLLDMFRHDIHEVEQLLGWDCSDWLSN